MMHLQQTKAGSRESGGPQYYFHNVDEPVKEFLRRRKACPVLLQTPYGIAESSFMAVGRDHKLANGKVVSGRVGHDRIQQAEGRTSLGEAIRYWYGLKEGDFETIEVEVSIHRQGHFILIPTQVAMRGGKRQRLLEKIHAPLSFHRDHQSKLWRNQIEERRQAAGSNVAWAAEQIRRVVREHRKAQSTNIHEADLLRVSGALAMLGVRLSPYLTKGYDCAESCFKFLDLPEYPCPLEIKKRSSGFKTYQVARYAQLPRAVVLCLDHDWSNPLDQIDVVELSALGAHLSA